MSDTKERGGYTPDDYGDYGAEHEDPNDDTFSQNPVEPVLGNTLDYYNDDMSRKVVGRLFASNEEPQGDVTPMDNPSMGLVKGFSSDRLRNGSRQVGSSTSGAPSPSSSRYPLENTFTKMEPPSEDPALIVSRRRRHQGAISQAAGYDPNKDPINEDDLSFGLYRKKHPFRNRDPEPDMDSDSDISSRQAARRKARVATDYDDPSFEPAPDPPPRTSKVYKKIEPQREFESQRADPFVAKRQAPPSRPPARKPRFAVHREDEDDEDDGDYDRARLPMRTVFIAAGGFLGLLIISIVVWQFVSLNNKLALATQEAEQASAHNARANALNIENNTLRRSLEDAQAEIARLEDSLTVAVPQAPVATVDAGVLAPPLPTHMVQPGQTLSAIAAQRLGDSTRWPEIAELNGIQPPHTVVAGRVLKIPAE